MRCAHGCVVWLCVVGFGEICSQVARVCSGGAHVHVRRTCGADGVIAAVLFSQVKCMLMTKDESTLITGDYGDSVIVWDISSGERKSTLKADGRVRCFASCGGALWCVDCECGAGAERVGLALWSPILRQAGRRSASACACCRVCGWWCAFAMVLLVCAVCRVLLGVSRLRRVCGRVARWHGDGHGVGGCGVHMVAFCGCVF